MGGGEITFAKLPAIYNVPIQNQQLGRYAFQIMYQLPGMTAIGAQVNIT